MPRTVWLASYPKSGNTWFRIFLANLLYPQMRPLDFNELPLRSPIASSRVHFDKVLRIPSAFLTPGEISRLRPEADRLLNAQGKAPLLIRKVHDAYTWLPDGRPLLGRGAEFTAIYILRDPWDVAVSTAHFYSLTLNEAVEQVANDEFGLTLRCRGLAAQLAQRLLSWGGHVMSWVNAPMRLHLLRYEAMKREPLAAFRGAVRFLGLEHDDAAIQSAVEASRIEHLQQQERNQRFRETPARIDRFFRRGTIGEGVARLTPDQMERLARMKQRVEQVIAERVAVS